MTKKAIASVLFLLVLFFSLKSELLRESKRHAALTNAHSVALTLLQPPDADARLHVV
jgi:hypothetical protein